MRSQFVFRLNPSSGVPVYRQVIDQVLSGLATGALSSGEQLPTVRQLAVDLAINPNTVIRAYRELELRGILETQQGSGTFISNTATGRDSQASAQHLQQIADEAVARAGAAGFSLADLQVALQRRQNEAIAGTSQTSISTNKGEELL